jgi:hypothetical protein
MKEKLDCKEKCEVDCESKEFKLPDYQMILDPETRKLRAVCKETGQWCHMRSK